MIDHGRELVRQSVFVFNRTALVIYQAIQLD